MLLSKRSLLPLFAAAALAGCGFTPVYGPGGAGQGLIGQVDMRAPTDRNEQHLVRELEQRFGDTASAPYTLDYRLVINEERMAITSSNTATRFDLVGSAEYRLIDAASQILLTEGKVDNFTGYSATGTTVATLAAERDAYERLSRLLAGQIATRLIASAPDLPQ